MSIGAVVDPAENLVAQVTHYNADAAEIRCGNNIFDLSREQNEPADLFAARCFEAARAFFPSRIEVMSHEQFEEIRERLEKII